MFDSQSGDSECSFTERRKQKWTAEEKRSQLERKDIFTCATEECHQFPYMKTRLSFVPIMSTLYRIPVISERFVSD